MSIRQLGNGADPGNKGIYYNAFALPILTGSPLHTHTHTHTHTQQLLEELQEKEQDIEALQSYASLLVQRIVEQAPDLLESIIQLQETQTIT